MVLIRFRPNDLLDPPDGIEPTTVEVRVLAAQILAAANADSLPVLPDVIQDRLKGTADDLRAFLKTDVQKAWSTALRITVVRTLTDAGPNVRAATQKTLDTATIDAYLAYLNDGLYAARALACASQPAMPCLERRLADVVYRTVSQGRRTPAPDADRCHLASKLPATFPSSSAVDA